MCVIEADSLQLRVITVGLYLFLSRSLLCQILAVCGRRLRGVLVPGFSAIPEPCCFPGLRSPETRLPIASLRYPPQPLRKAPFLPTESSASAYGKLRFCLRKAPPLPYGSSASALRKAPFSFSLCITSCNNSLFPQLNPPVFIVTVYIYIYIYIVQNSWSVIGAHYPNNKIKGIH